LVELEEKEDNGSFAGSIFSTLWNLNIDAIVVRNV
jgi:hypothetical protein